MENKPLTALVGAIQKFSTEDGPGIRTTVFLKGCPLDCKWCHNPELISFSQQVIEMPNSCIKCGYCRTHCPAEAIYLGEDERIHVDRTKCTSCMKCADFCFAKALQPVAKLMSPEEVMAEVEKDKGFYENTGGGMTISGGEVMSHSDFAEALIELAAEKEISVCLDTSGFCDGERLLELAQKSNVTHILYDMKAIDDAVHQTYTGQSNQRIIENLRMLAGNPLTCQKLQMRMPLVSGVNDTDSIIEKTCDFYRENGIEKLTLLPYHNLGVSKKRNIGEEAISFTPPSDERVEKIKAYFEEQGGMKVEILGKV